MRALETLKSADAVACEEFREGSTLLKKLGIGEKKLMILNEHNEKEGTEEIFQALLSGQTIALVSDCGTPAFADPWNNPGQTVPGIRHPGQFGPGCILFDGSNFFITASFERILFCRIPAEGGIRTKRKAGFP